MTTVRARGTLAEQSGQGKRKGRVFLICLWNAARNWPYLIPVRLVVGHPPLQVRKPTFDP